MGAARWSVALATAAVSATLAGCGASADDSGDFVDWYVTPGPADVESLAQTCNGAGAPVRIHELPSDPDERHAFLIRTLRNDPSEIDLLSVDASAIPELASAGFLSAPSSARATQRTEGVVPAAVESTSYDGELVATPWLVDPQLLWFRTVAAERAGLDTTQQLTWDDLIAGADRLGVTVQVADTDGNGLAGWVSGLVASGTGALVDGPGSDATVGLDSNPGRGAAGVVEFYRESLVGPGPTADAVDEFLRGSGGFLIAPASTFADPDLRSNVAQVGVVAYPVIRADQPVSPITTLALAVPTDAPQGSDAEDVIDCLTEATTVRSIMVDSGYSSPRPAALDDPALALDLPTVPQLKLALSRATTLPVTPYWDAVRRAIDATWRPLETVTSERTPVDSQAAVEAALRGGLS